MFEELENEELISLFMDCYKSFIDSNNVADLLEVNDCITGLLERMK